ncbi:hypothetical protein AAF712_016443 [Marasmius tenuissimus]|uniref:Uncharacterized protein n=1 Tax=Marasmius tenuissimus TaxID=585030 RepID=A0ABR2Z5P3_9AGAR
MGRATYSSHFQSDGSFSSPYSFDNSPPSPSSDAVRSPRSQAIMAAAVDEYADMPGLELDPDLTAVTPIPTMRIPPPVTPSSNLSSVPLSNHRLNSVSRPPGARLTAIHLTFREWSLDLSNGPEPEDTYTTDIPFSFPYSFETRLRDAGPAGEPRLMDLWLRDPELTYDEIELGVKALTIVHVSDTDFFHEILPFRYRDNRFPYCLDVFLHILSHFSIINDVLYDFRSNLPIARDDPYAKFMAVVDRWQSDPSRDACFSARPTVFRSLVQEECGLFFTDGLIYAKLVVSPFTYRLPSRFQVGRLAPFHHWIFQH